MLLTAVILIGLFLLFFGKADNGAVNIGVEPAPEAAAATAYSYQAPPEATAETVNQPASRTAYAPPPQYYGMRETHNPFFGIVIPDAVTIPAPPEPEPVVNIIDEPADLLPDYREVSERTKI